MGIKKDVDKAGITDIASKAEPLTSNLSMKAKDKNMLRARQPAELAGVSLPTIKHYVKGGPIPKPLRTGKTRFLQRDHDRITMLVGGSGPSMESGVAAATGNHTAGILTILGVTFLAGTDMLILSRFLKYQGS